MNTKTQNSFSVHPSVIKSIILEQAGDPCKALAELVMNSVDAGATYVDINLDSKGFNVKDDGEGFKSREDIISYFGTFGTPHADGDAEFGKFRIGRGQLFGISSSYWRSGFFGMEVNLDGLQNRTDIGYLLVEHDEKVKGCEITGSFFSPLHTNEGFLNADHFNESLNDTIEAFKLLAQNKPHNLVQLLTGSVYGPIKNRIFIRLFELLLLVKIPVRVNGVNITRMLPMKLMGTNTVANFYIFDKPSVNVGTIFLNKGVHIYSIAYPVPIVIDFKNQPQLNMARNSINKECPKFKRAVRYLIEKSFTKMLSGDTYYKGFLNNILASIISTSPNYLFSDSFIPYEISTSELNQMMKLVRLNTFSTKDVKLSLFDLLVDFEAHPDKCHKKYKFVAESVIQNFGGVNELKEKVADSIDDYILIYGANGQYFDNQLFGNLDYLYRHAGQYTEYFEVSNSIDLINFELKPQEPVFKTEKGLLVYGCYKELTPSLYKKHGTLKEFLHEIIQEMRVYLQNHFGELHLQENNLLMDQESFAIKFMKISGGRTNNFSRYGDIRYVHLDGQHLMVFDPLQISKKMQGLSSYEHYFHNSVAVNLYMAILNCHEDKSTPLSSLHDLRKKNENLLFGNISLREDLAYFDSKITKFIRMEKPSVRKSAKSMAADQKKIKLIKNLMDAEFGGLSEDLANNVSKILAVEV